MPKGKKETGTLIGSPKHRRPKVMNTEKRELAYKLYRRIEEIAEALHNGVPSKDLERLQAEKAQLINVLSDLGFSMKSEKYRAKGLKSYFDAIRQRNESAREISGRDSITARLVQGGSPGSRQGGKT